MVFSNPAVSLTVADSLSEALRDRYQLERELGRGGMATVYLAHDLRHDRPVALKVLHPELAHALGPERFLREIRTTARLDHPHILPVFDSGEAAGLLWYTMPYVEGESLRDRLRREGQLPMEEALRLTREVADALDCAHQHGVVHRDIKPENILLAGGHARVADFGVATALEAAGGGRLTETGLAVGTPTYMSPEQATGGQVDGRSDQYSLGCVLYEMLAGEPPYTGPTAQAIIAKRFSEPVPHLGTLREVPASVEAAVRRALSKSPADRFATLSEFAAALERKSQKRLVTRRMATLIGGITALTVLGLLAFLQRPRSTPVPVAAHERSLAVLPLVNVGGDPKEEYLSDGLTEELIAALGRVPGLRVAARSSAFAFKGKPVDVKEVGSKLSVANVLEGSIRRSGNHLRVTAELVKVSDGLTLWSESYAREMKDVFQVQDDLAKAITGALRVTLTGGDSSRLITPPTGNIEAYNLFLQGMYFWNKRSEGGFRRATTLFEQAIALDSGYAQAWAGLGAAYTLLGEWGFDVPVRMFSLGRQAALKALSLDSTLAGAHAVLGWVKMGADYDLPGAEAELRRARALEPGNPLAYHWHAWTLVSLGRVNDAVEEIKRARELDPFSLPINRSLGLILGVAGRYQEAAAQLQHALALDPNFAATHWTLGLVYLAQGKWREAIPELEADIAGRSVGLLGFAYAKAGQPEKAKELLRKSLEDSRRGYVAPGEIARIYLGLGDRERALDWLQRSYDDRSLAPYAFWPDTLFSEIRSDPRFLALQRKMGIKK